MDVLIAGQGRTNAYQFINMLVDDRNDYTKWRKYLFHGMTVEEISSQAMKEWEKNNSER